MSIELNQNFVVGVAIGFLLGGVIVSAAYFIFGVMISYITTPKPITKDESDK